MPGPGVPAPNGQHIPTEGGSRGLIWDPRCPRPGSEASGRDRLEPGPGKEKPTWRERLALLGLPIRLHSLRPVPSWWSLTVLGGVVFQAAQNAQRGVLMEVTQLRRSTLSSPLALGARGALRKAEDRVGPLCSLPSSCFGGYLRRAGKWRWQARGAGAGGRCGNECGREAE